MDDLIALLFCAMMTAVVIGTLVAFAVWLSRLGKTPKAAVLQQELDALRGENFTLAARVSRLEAGLSRLQASGASAPAMPTVEWPAWGAGPRMLAEPPSSGVSEPQAGPEAADSAAADAPAEVAAMEASSSAASDVPSASAPERPSEAAAPSDPAAAATSSDSSADAAAEPASASNPAGADAESAPAPSRSIGWEQWVGVRGAAALGASILLLAGVYFFEYSIEHGLITPAMRVVLGTVVGLGCVLASELRLRKTHTVLANWLAGAGIGILYVAFWAGRALYELYPTWAAGGLMVVTTGACVALATRHRSKAIAALGLLGGFITPVALSTGSDQPISLFGYLLLLDGAMLWVAYRRRWAWLAGASLLGSMVYEATWLFGRLDEPRLFLGVGIIAAFSGLFALASRGKPSEEDEPESGLYPVVRSAGVLLPMFFTVGLAGRGDLGSTLAATAVLLVVLSTAACVLGVRHRSAFLPSAAALAVVGTLVVWTVAHEPSEVGTIWQVLGLASVEALIFTITAGWARHRGITSALPPAATYLFTSLIVLLFAAPFAEVAGPWPWLMTWAVSVGAAAWLGRGRGWEALPVGVSVLAALGLGGQFAATVGDAHQPGGLAFLGILVLAAAASSLLGLFGGEETRRPRDVAAGAFALVLLGLVSLVQAPRHVPSWGLLAAVLVLLFLVLLVAARRGQAAFVVLGMVATVFAQGVWVARLEHVGLVELSFVFTGVLMVSGFAALCSARLREQPWTWRAAALVGPLSLLTLRHLWLETLGDAFLGALPIGLAAVAVATTYAARMRGPVAVEARRTAMVWLIATAAGFGTLAIPMQLSNEWLTIGWALEALALTALWRRMDHTGLKYAALGLAGAVCVRLLGNPFVLDYADRGWPILNWIAYTYLVPAGSLLGMWALLRGLEPERRRPWERSLFAQAPVLSGVVAAGAIALAFAWVNLAIVDLFSVGPDIDLPFDRLPARDLSLSIAWAVFALGLLALGMVRRSTALRATSLALILVTMAKVFLYDLGNLADLYRVASLVGLALSLIVISLAYQRFVFRTAKEAA